MDWADVEVEPEVKRVPLKTNKPKQQEQEQQQQHQYQQHDRQSRSYSDSNSRANGNGHGNQQSLRRQGNNNNNNNNNNMHRGHDNNTSRGGGRGGKGNRGGSRGGKNRDRSVINGGRQDVRTPPRNQQQSRHQRGDSRDNRDTRSIGSGGSGRKVEMGGHANGRSSSTGGGGTSIFQAALGSAVRQPQPIAHGSNNKHKKSPPPAPSGHTSALGNPIAATRSSPSPPSQRTSSFGNSSTVTNPATATAVPQVSSLGNPIPVKATSALGNTPSAAPPVAATKTRGKGSSNKRQDKQSNSSEGRVVTESKAKANVSASISGSGSAAASNEAMKKLQVQLESMRVAKAKSENRAKVAENELETFAKKDIQKDAELKLLDGTNKSFRNIRNKLEKERDELRIKAYQAEKRATAAEAENKELKENKSNSAAATGPAIAALQQRIVAMSADVEAANAGWVKAHAHSERQQLDIEMHEAQTKYDEARIENLDITVAEQALQLASSESANIDLEVEMEELKHALEVSEKALEEARAELLLAGNSNDDGDCANEATVEHDEDTQDVDDGGSEDDDRDCDDRSNQDEDRDGDNGSNEDDDSDDGEEKPWLLAIQEESEEEVRRALEVDENELIVLDASDWTSFDAFVRSIAPLLTRAQREDPNATQACVAAASALEPFSRAFWQMCCDTLTKVCDLVTVVIVDMSKEEETDASISDVPKRDELLRLLVCVVYEAYSLAENADKFVVALRGVKPGNLGAEDPTGNAANPSFHNVATLEDLEDNDDDDDDDEVEEEGEEEEK